ncbi:hypothetical protein [Novipirellula artificiosorum]|uniref:hypothetical protein n=1 Tax=Novipirellula artificiosorum TaxID=2528016 RepID=UPI0011B537D3|nr:hypothetical protein [Novipirellula artificiosorum]
MGTESEVRHHAQPLMQRVPIRIAEPEVVIREAQAGDLALFFSEHFERFRGAIRRLQHRNIATLYVIDGILEWRNAWENREQEPACPWTMRPVLCHKVACIGSSQARTLCDWGNSHKVEVVGVPRLDELRKQENSVERSDDPFRILIMTAKWPGYTDAQRQQIRQSLLDLKAWSQKQAKLGNRPIQLIWRLTAGLDRIIGVENELRNTTGDDVAEALRRADATITTPSTAQLESMLMGKPTAILDYTNSPVYVDSAWRITSKVQLDSTIQQLCDPPAERMHFQRCLLHDALQLEVNATDRMITLLEKMSEESHKRARQPQPLPFPSGLLPALRNQPQRLCTQTAFPQSDAFRLNDPTMVQVELADAQRQVKQLHAKIDQLNTELGQAHEIFETIHKHPIAGPVVRAREKFLQWVARLKANKADPT